VKRQVAIQDLLFGDPDQSWRHDCGVQIEMRHSATTIIIPKAVSAISLCEYLCVEAGRRHRSGHIVFGTHRVRGTAAFCGESDGRQQGSNGACQQARGGVVMGTHYGEKIVHMHHFIVVVGDVSVIALESPT